MKYVLIQAICLLVLPFAFVRAESTADSYVKTHVFSSSNSGGYVESHVETSGNSEVRVQTVINGEVVEDIHLENEEAEQVSETFREELPLLPESLQFEFKRVDVTPEGHDIEVDIEEESVFSLFEQLRIPEDFSLEPIRTTIFSLKNDKEPGNWSASIFEAINGFIIKFF